jgi:hypothetical protein
MVSTGSIAIFNILFAIGLLVLVVWIASALGVYVLGVLGVENLSGLEMMVFSTALGLGVLAYGIFFLGLMGLLKGEVIAGLLFFIGLATCGEMYTLLRKTYTYIMDFPRRFRRINLNVKIFFILGCLVLALSLMQSLTPPWDYDGLLYHLQGPRLFLEAGRIYPVRDNWLVYYPFTPEMLFTLGMSINCDYFSKLVHLGFAIILLLSTYACAKRFLGKSSAWLSPAILIGIPLYPIWASFAYGDMAWSVYEFLAVYAALLWMDSQKRQWLMLAGILMGFALGSKYMAFGGAIALGIWLLWRSRSSGWRGLLVNGFLFGGIALGVGAPWYLKNWVWTGSPLYPMFISAQDPNLVKWELWSAYMIGFGSGRGVVDYLLLPIRLYTQYHRFGTFLGSIEIPSLLFPLLVLYPWTNKTRQTNAWLGIAIICFAFWAAGPQQSRFLLPLFPLLSLLTAFVLSEFATRLPKQELGMVLSTGLALGVVATTLLYSVLFFSYVAPMKVILGLESKTEFLERNIALFSMQQHIQDKLPEQVRVLMLWDGRGYYCDQRCLPDTSQSQWTALVSRTWEVNQVAKDLRQQGVTHLLFSEQDAIFVSQYDVSGLQKKALAFLIDDFIPSCTHQIHHTEYYSLMELTCP